ncbi:MAG: hypothetical protein O7I42_05460 [Alphaproteobacteria bacterium]|nr:hypothetical protein [Alphaproteobacteria bacterium]
MTTSKLAIVIVAVAYASVAQPEPIDNLVQIAAIGDLNGNNTTDFAVLLRDSDTDRNKLYVIDGGSGKNIRTVSFGSQRARGSTIVPDATGDLIPEFAVLLEGSLFARIKDVVNNTLLGKPKFNANYDTVAFLSVGDAGSAVGPDVAVVGRLPATGKVQAWVKDVASGSLVKRMTFSKVFVPFAAVAVDNVSDSAAMEIAVLGIDASGNVQAQVKDALTGNLINKIKFNKNFTPLFFAAVPNVGGKLKLLTVLGQNASGDIQAQTKRGRDGKLVSNVKFSKSYEPRAFISFADSNGSGRGEIAVIGVNDTGKVRAQVKEIADGTHVKYIFFSKTYSPLDAIAINGVAGTGRNEIAVLGKNASDQYRLQVKDLLTGDLVKNIPLPSPSPPTANLAPIAIAGEDQLVVTPTTITLDGGGSSDSDGSIVKYSWNQILGSPIQLAQPDVQMIQFDTPVGSSSHFLVFELTVTDNDGAVSTDRVSVVARSISPTGDLVAVWNDNLIIRELGADELQPENLFDLEGMTLRFTPEGPRFRVQSVPFQWDPDFGSALIVPRDSAESGSVEVSLTNFDFPFSGTSWESIFVNQWGNITFTGPQEGFFEGGRTRHVPMRNYGKTMIGRAPIISPLFRLLLPTTPDLTAYAKELSDRIVITWEVEEAIGFTRYIGNTGTNRFQAVLHETGEIEFSYETIIVRDGVVGIFPQGSEEEELGTINDPVDALFPAHLDIVSVTASLIGTRFVRFDLALRDLLLEGDPQIDPISYIVNVDLEEPFAQSSFSGDIDLRFGVLGTTDNTYQASGDPITSPQVTISGDTISFTTGLDSFDGMNRVGFITTVSDDVVFDHTNLITIDLPPLFEPQVEDLSQISELAPAREVIYEEFYYPDVRQSPEEGDGRAALQVCAVIEAFGDKFDFIVLYTDFRIDRSTPSSATIPVNSAVTGLGQANDNADPAVFCSDGQFQGGVQPAWIGAPRFGENESFSGARLRSNYDYHLARLLHELGHRWMAPRYARIAGQRVEIGNTNGHWQIGLHAPVAFRAPRDPSVDEGWQPASVMGVYHWLDNKDGTFTPLADPGGPGYSYLDLYLLGLLAEHDVPDFFLIENLVSSGGTYTGNRVNLTIGNYIAENGPRSPMFDTSQKDFNIGFVGIVQNGELPSLIMIERMAGIRQVWLEYWPTATGGVSTMTSTPYPPP